MLRMLWIAILMIKLQGYDLFFMLFLKVSSTSIWGLQFIRMALIMEYNTEISSGFIIKISI